VAVRVGQVALAVLVDLLVVDLVLDLVDLRVRVDRWGPAANHRLSRVACPIVGV